MMHERPPFATPHRPPFGEPMYVVPSPGVPRYPVVLVPEVPASLKVLGSLLVAGRVAAAVTGLAGVFHGYRRTGDAAGAALYGVLGYALWPVAIPVMLAQGFGQRAPVEPPRSAFSTIPDLENEP